MTKTTFTEADTEAYYDQQDSLYQSFWDREGSLHWGYFEDIHSDRSSTPPKNTDVDSKTDSNRYFVRACQHWNEVMLRESGIDKDSKVLDVGCGNGNTALWLADKTGCEVVGVDLSQVRIENARKKLQQRPELRVSFEKASATELPFSDGSFTHVWSQATLYHVHERKKALGEIHRVLAEKGFFIFDDLITPVDQVNETAMQHVYSRLMFTPTFSLAEYKQCLTDLGIMVLKAEDLSSHLYQSYTVLSKLALPEYDGLSKAYKKMCESIQQQQVGWSYYLGQKVSDSVAWVYEAEEPSHLEARYDAWAPVYDRELNNNYRQSPQLSAKILAEVLPDKQAAVLDVGAGTGMVGEAMHELGYNNVTALDVSADMLEQARKKQVYSKLVKDDLHNDLTYLGIGQFDAIIAVGVFTFNHAEPRALHQLAPLLKPGGYFVLTVREDFFKENQLLRDELKKLSWKMVKQSSFCIFDDEPVLAMVLQTTIS